MFTGGYTKHGEIFSKWRVIAHQTIGSTHQPKKPGWCPSMSGFTIGSSSFPRKNCRKFTGSHWRGAVDVQLTFNQFSWKAGLYPMFMENSIYHDISWYIMIYIYIYTYITHYIYNIIKLAIKLWGFFQIRFRPNLKLPSVATTTAACGHQTLSLRLCRCQEVHKQWMSRSFSRFHWGW